MGPPVGWKLSPNFQCRPPSLHLLYNFVQEKNLLNVHLLNRTTLFLISMNTSISSIVGSIIMKSKLDPSINRKCSSPTISKARTESNVFTYGEITPVDTALVRWPNDGGRTHLHHVWNVVGFHQRMCFNPVWSFFFGRLGNKSSVVLKSSKDYFDFLIGRVL